MRYLLLIIVLSWVCCKAASQQVGIKNNVLWDGATVPNAGGEFALATHWTLDVWGAVDALDYGDDMQLKLYLLQPELRYWPCQKFEGSFWGLHVHGAHFNVGMFPFISSLERTVYRGNLYGAGLSYGYHFPLGKRWGLEMTVGVGYAYIDYQKYYCTYCAEPRGKGVKHYLGPTRAGISLIYLIK